MLVGIVFVSACSTNYLYERLDWFVVWRVGSIVTLTDVQEETLQEDVQAYLDKIRVDEMPRAADNIRSMMLQIEAGDITPDDIDRRYQEGMEFFEEIILGIVPISRDFLLSLSDEQVEELVESFYEMNDEMYDEYSGRTAEEREKNRDRSAVRGVQGFTGRLSDEQKELIKSRIASMEDSSERWIDYQRVWQDQFKALLLERPAEPQITEELTALLVYPRKFHSPEYKAIVEKNRQILNVMIADLFATLTPKQRDHMLGELDEYVQLLMKLSQMPT
ncbi:MAG: DUF6279 family lipoprotein [Gammaproteobacteria bacterium]|nr:DUF6279 family lipoprotein [Gammaproteobacteria bacterium]MDP6616255.1 DUF6279 family lipoprotein [Gammaproteobacteria bacterium]MDP6695438.1 DUF6279 family lipoprotein [Gammaproteobacteria bacterium]